MDEDNSSNKLPEKLELRVGTHNEDVIFIGEEGVDLLLQNANTRMVQYIVEGSRPLYSE